MKQLESNPLRQALAQSQGVEPHPDADLLTALAEGSLLQRERQRLLTHLAVCAECREALGAAAEAALDSADEVKPFVLDHVMPPRRRIWLPWTSMAALLLVAVSAVLFYQRRPALPTSPTIATKGAVQSPVAVLQQSKEPPASQPMETAKKEAKSEPRSRMEADAGLDQLRQLPLPEETSAAKTAQQDHAVLAVNPVPGLLSESQPSEEDSKSEALGAPVLKAARVPSASAFVNTTTERALSAPSATAATRPHWRINGAGQAERAFGDGSWAAVLTFEPSRMRVVSVFGGEVWIGGDHSRLYRSTDNGTTWTLVPLPDKNGREHSIAHIRFQTRQSGTVESADGVTWTTVDGGDTWN